MATLLTVCSRALRYPDGGWAAALEEAMNAACSHGLEGLLRSLAKELKGCDPGVLQDEYYRLFSPAGKVGIDLVRHVDPNPTAQAQALASLAGFYQGFGVENRIGRMDEAPVILELTAWVEAKLAWAQAQGLDEEAEVTASALQDLLRTWVLPGLTSMAGKLEQEDGAKIYRLSAGLALEHARALETQISRAFSTAVKQGAAA